MKKLLVLSILITCTSCTITGPYTGTKYAIGYNDNDGIYIKAKPLAIQSITDLLSK